MRYLPYTILCLLFVCGPAFADDTSDVENLLKRKVDAVLSVLQNKTLDQEKINGKIIKIIETIFDLPLMAKLSLGKEHWLALSTQENRTKFTKLFIHHLKASYLGKLALYTDEAVIYEPSKKVKSKVYIPTYLASKDSKISILYKLYQSKKGWKVYDIEIQGVSFIKSYRSQFNSVLKKGSIEDLFKKLEAPDQLSSHFDPS